MEAVWWLTPSVSLPVNYVEWGRIHTEYIANHLVLQPPKCSECYAPWRQFFFVFRSLQIEIYFLVHLSVLALWLEQKHQWYIFVKNRCHKAGHPRVISSLSLTAATYGITQHYTMGIILQPFNAPSPLPVLRIVYWAAYGFHTGNLEHKCTNRGHAVAQLQAGSIPDRGGGIEFSRPQYGPGVESALKEMSTSWERGEV